MTRAGLFGTLWLCAVAASVGAVVRTGEAPAAAEPPVRAARDAMQPVALPQGGYGLPDVGGHVVQLKPYTRIASGSSAADMLLLAMAEPERVVALSDYGYNTAAQPYLYGDRARLVGVQDVERLLALDVDLLVLHHLGSPAELARAREAGIEVFNLGELRGLSTLLPNIQALATLLGDASRADAVIQKFTSRLEAVARHIPEAQRKRGMYVSAYGGQLFGGGANTSYHELLHFAGLVDVAAAHFQDYPQYDPEQLLALDPDIIVTHDESRDVLCRTSALSRLRACQDQQAGVVGLPSAVAGDPGLGLLDAVELLHERVYGANAKSP